MDLRKFPVEAVVKQDNLVSLKPAVDPNRYRPCQPGLRSTPAPCRLNPVVLALRQVDRASILPVLNPLLPSPPAHRQSTPCAKRESPCPRHLRPHLPFSLPLPILLIDQTRPHPSPVPLL